MLKQTDERLIKLPMEDTKENYLNDFWQWVGLMVADDYQGALEALYWPHGLTDTAANFKHRVTNFFGGESSWSVVIPNDRLIGVINDAADIQMAGQGWLMAQIPLTTEPADPKNDMIPLMGLATSFSIRELSEYYVMEFEIFHL